MSYVCCKSYLYYKRKTFVITYNKYKVRNVHIIYIIRHTYIVKYGYASGFLLVSYEFEFFFFSKKKKLRHLISLHLLVFYGCLSRRCHCCRAVYPLVVWQSRFVNGNENRGHAGHWSIFMYIGWCDE